MSLSTLQVQAIASLGDALYEFLPGTPHPRADQRISFPGAARACDLGSFWTGGSKRPATAMLLQRTLDERSDRFCRLIVEIVNRAIVYRRNKSPLTRSEIERVNEAVRKLGFKVPELWDPAFLASLAQSDGGPESREAATEAMPPQKLSELKQHLFRIGSLPPQERGYAFERFLTDLFSAFGMAPRGGYRLRGEQIDGSFEDERDYYLVEAKWQTQKIGAAELRSFLGAVDSKAEWSRGCYISYSGFSAEGLFAFGQGRSTRVICVDAEDLFHVVDGKVHLRDLIRKKARHAAERGEAFAPARELFLNVI